MGLLPKQGVTRTQRIIKIPKLAQRSNKLPNVAPQQQAKYSVQSYKKQPNIIKQAEAVVKPRPKRIQIGKPQRTAKNQNKTKVTYYKSEISEENKLKLKQLRNYGVGKVLIIMANGPSILNANVEILKNHPKIDIMSINKPDMRVWPSTFWLFCDQSQLRRNQELWNAYDGMLINTQSIKAKHNTIHMRNLGQSIGFSKDLVNGVHLGKSSCYTAMQAAYWMNYDHVYIFGCLPDGEKILTSGGMKAINTITEHDLVFTTDGFKNPTNFMRRAYNGKLYAIRTWYNNIPLRLTGEHPILTIDQNNNKIFKNADRLSINDTCCYPIDRTERKTNLCDEFWWLTGLYVAEGYTRTQGKYRYAVFCLGRHETGLASVLERAAYVATGHKITRDKRSRPSQELILNDADFGAFVDKHVGKLATAKFLDELIMTLPLQQQLAFLMGYIAGDGSIFKRQKNGYHECTLSTASESLAEGLQKMLLRFNIISSLTKSNRPSGFDRKNTGQFGIRYHISIVGTQMAKLGMLLGIDVITADRDPTYATIIDDDLHVKVRDILVTDYDGYVNNIEVSGPHTYCGRLIMTHNCDMGTVNIDGTNMLHHYGHNPDVIHNNRVARFSEEAKSYDYAANILTPTERMKYTFCTSHNKFSFVGMFGRMGEVEAPLKILSSLS